jgi:hypothetical protein
MQLHVQEPYASLLKGDLISFSLFHCTIQCMYLVSPTVLNPKLKPVCINCGDDDRRSL